MALVSVSSKCFTAVEKALHAVKTGDSRLSVVLLKSIEEDGLLLQREASVLCDQLSKAEEDQQQKVEDLTRQMNELYVEETQLAKRKELENRKTSLTGEKECCHLSKEEASRRYRVAQQEKREAEEKYDELKRWFWVPVYGTFLVVRELIEENGKKVSAAYGEMKRFEREMERAESEISWANSEIFKAENDLERISGKVENLKRQREECHEKLGDVKSMMSFIMQAVGFWDEVVTVTKEATVKTEHIQRIVDLAAKKNTLKILRSSGTQTMMKSFTDGWMEVAEMITSDRNVIFEKGLGAYGVSKTALLGLTKVLANECGHMGVRVNCVAPGIIKTRFSEALWKNETILQHSLSQIPLGRIGLSEDIGGAVSFLSSDQASYITGETLVIGGGLQSRL